MILLQPPDDVRRARLHRQLEIDEHRERVSRLDRRLPLRDAASYPELLRALERTLDMPVVVSAAAWNAPPPAPRAGIRETLDASGLRWAVQDRALFLMEP